ncbi:proline-rich protein 2 [Amyelois transitella]|uniref:proline-rich protein 2 n=1 Tax=Amyelois transitella TaxID=680683 RepID=UPI00067C3140|nr:proline-rich protein 2 [Amyelois transitella]XP_013186256.1 proline-rich protein 2 [Amyelois transitella]XP_060805841.1 proline-rich protein 2 [Amyelois transitella]
MTSTSFNVGLGEAPRMSSRVLRPPGGGHTDIFGGDPEPPRGRRQFPGVANAGQGDEPPKPQNGTSPTQNGQAETPPQEVAPPPEPSPAQPESPAKTEPAPESKPEPSPPQSSPTAAEPKAEPPKVEPPKRVRVPPGGFSSGLW